MPVHSNRAAVEARMQQAEADALFAAAQHYRNAMTENLRGGYTSGAFAHGMDGVAGSVSVSEPQRDNVSAFVVVGTNVEYAKFWELGHVNLFTRKYERVEKWRPTLEQEAPAMIEKFARVYARLMEAA
jgi:hypothetical protein